MHHGPEKPIYFTIVRDPVSLFISVWDYYGLPGLMSKEKRSKTTKIIVKGQKNIKNTMMIVDFIWINILTIFLISYLFFYKMNYT